MSELKINETQKQTITTLEIAEMLGMKHYKVLENWMVQKIEKPKELLKFLTPTISWSLIILLNPHMLTQKVKTDLVILSQNLDAIFLLINSQVKKEYCLQQNM